MKYYLAYGSNLSVRRMGWRCPDAVCVGTAEIPGYRLLFRGSKTGSYLTIEKWKGRKVPVLVWRVSDDDERALDRYEGYPRFYRKETMKVQLQSFADPTREQEIEAFVYIMDERRPLGKPTVDYVQTCLEGYRRFGFDETILETAYLESVMGRRMGELL